MAETSADEPAVTFSGITGASALAMQSTTRWIWLKRASAAAGYSGLKIVPLGAVTLMGRKEPSFCGTCSLIVALSSRSARKAK